MGVYMRLLMLFLRDFASSTTNTKGYSETHGESTTVTTSGGGSGGSRKSDDQVDAVSGAAPSVKNRRY